MSNIITRLHNDAEAFMKSMLWEFQLIFKDKAVFFSFIGVSIIVSIVYGYVYSNEVLKDLPIAVVDQDNSTHSRQLLRMIDGTQQVNIDEIYTDLEQAKIAFYKGQNRGIVVVPSDFSRKIQRGDQPSVSVYADASFILYYKQVLTAVKTAVSYLNAGVKIKKKSAQGNLFEVAKAKAIPVNGKVIGLFNPNAGYGTFLLPIIIVIIFQTTILTAIGILGGTMRENRIMHKMYPHSDRFLGTVPIVMGKATTYLILSMLILLIMLSFILPLYDIGVRSSLLDIIVFMVPFILSIVYLGIFLINFFKKREDAIMWIMFTSLPAILITGFSWPVDAMPGWVQSIRYIVPSTLATKGFVAITQLGADFSIIKNDWLLLWALCLFYLILAILSTKRIYIIEKNK